MIVFITNMSEGVSISLVDSLRSTKFSIEFDLRLLSKNLNAIHSYTQ